MSIEKIFKECYDRHFDDVFRYLYWVTNSEDLAKDICQLTFEALWVRLEKEKVELESPAAWLRKVAQHKMQEHFRTQKRRDQKLDQLVYFQPGRFENKVNISRKYELAETEDEITMAITALGSPLREIIFYIDVEKKTYSEVQEILGFSERTIRRMRKRGWLKLEKTFEQLGLADELMGKVKAITKSELNS